MIRNVLGPDGRLHVERELGNMRHDMTTGETSYLGPKVGNKRIVSGPRGTETEIRAGNTKRRLGGDGPSYVLGQHS